MTKKIGQINEKQKILDEIFNDGPKNMDGSPEDYKIEAMFNGSKRRTMSLTEYRQFSEFLKHHQTLPKIKNAGEKSSVER